MLQGKFWVWSYLNDSFDEVVDSYFSANRSTAFVCLVGEDELEEAWERRIGVMKAILEKIEAAAEEDTVGPSRCLGEVYYVFEVGVFVNLL